MENKITVAQVYRRNSAPYFKEIVDSDPSLELVGQYDNIQQAILDCVKSQPDIVVVPTSLEDTSITDLATAIKQSCPSVSIIMSCSSLTSEEIGKAFAVGIRFCVDMPFDRQQTIDVIKAAFEYELKYNNLHKD